MSLILTLNGLAAYTQADVSGIKLKATHMAVGDGGGAVVVHTSASTELVNETWRAPLQEIKVADSGEVEFVAHVPITVGGWWVREVAIYAGEVLLAIGTHPETWKPDPAAPDKLELVITGPVKFDNADVLNLTVDTTKVLASQDHVAAKIAEHDEDASAHAAIRELIRKSFTTNLTVYVAPDGNDDNDGLTVEAPMASINGAWRRLFRDYNLNGYTATIKLADGTYAEQVEFSGVPVGAAGSVYLVGNTSAPSAVLIQPSNPAAYTGGRAVVLDGGVDVDINGVTLLGYMGLQVGPMSRANVRNVHFGTATGPQIAMDFGGVVQMYGDVVATGAASYCIRATRGGTFVAYSGSTLTILSGAYSDATIGVDHACCEFRGGSSVSGTATGMRYVVSKNGVVDTVGAGVNYLPGDIAGVATNGGIYA